MRGRVNSYLAMLFITTIAGGAAFLIVHVVYANTFEITISGSEAEYTLLKKSILEK